MGRSSKVEAARTRARIVETASNLFRASGVDQIAVADIMGALGMTTGAFYRHFPSKGALAAEAVSLAFEQSTAAWQVAAARDKEKPPTRGAARLVKHYLRQNPDSRCPMIAFAAYAASVASDEASRDIYRQKAEALLERFIGPVKTKKRPPSAAERKAMVLFAAMIGTRMLKEAAGDVAWTGGLREAVLEAAKAPV